MADVTELVSRYMRIDGVSKSELACRLGLSRSSVSQYFVGGIRTVRVLERICGELGLELVIRRCRKEE